MPPDLGTILAHDDDLPLDAVVPPIVQSSLFTFADYETALATFRGDLRRPVYSRVGNPTNAVFEAKIAALEGAEAARGFASGMAAISAAVLSHVSADERIVAVRHLYPDAYRLFEITLRRFGISVDYVDGRDHDALVRALPGAKLLYLESPTSWVFETQDLDAISTMARDHGVLTVIDNSWATPVFQRPLTHGVDLVIHSASKYLSGHSDTVAGVVAGRRELIERINGEVLPYLGAKLAPFEAWLLIRGLRTLEIRMLAAQERAGTVMRWLRQRPEVGRLHYPEVDGRQLTGASSLFSFELADGLSVQRFIDALRLFRLGVSWGGHESLVFPAEITHQQGVGRTRRATSASARAPSGCMSAWRAQPISWPIWTRR